MNQSVKQPEPLAKSVRTTIKNKTITGSEECFPNGYCL